MRIAIFGATGGTGREIVQQGVLQGISFTALVRPGSKLPVESDRLTVISGAIENRTDVRAALQNSDAVCCVYGPRPPYTDLFCAPATKLILDEMASQGIKRIVCQTGAMIGHYPENLTVPFRMMAAIARKKMDAMMEDRINQEELILNSTLDWTIVKPSRLSDGGARKSYRASPDLKMGLFSSIARSDLAEFLLKELVSPMFLRHTVFIRY